MTTVMRMTGSEGTRRRAGRPPATVPKKHTAALLPLPVREACEREAAAGGWGSLSDYLLSLIAPAVGMPEHAPSPKYDTSQEVIPLTG